MDDYVIKGREIYSAKSGKLVATLDDDGNPVMAPGMAGPHSAKVKAWLGGQGAERGADAAGMGNTDVIGRKRTETDGAQDAGDTGADTGEPKTGNRKPETREATVDDIPESLLPPFSPELGTATPGFAEFIAQHQFTASQVAALVRRLENK